MTIPALSVVIIGRNEGERLARCLASVQAMQYPAPVEMIYVDSASVDGSLELARSLGALPVSVQQPRPNAATGRNAGWRMAGSSLVLFLDGDTIVNPHFAANALVHFEDESVAIVWGHRREVAPRASLYNRVLDLDWIYKPGIVAFSGGDALVRRSALESVDGFNEGLIAGEEPEMCRRMRGLGYKIVHIDQPMTGHDLAMRSIKQYWRRAMRAGYAYADVSCSFEHTEMPFWGNEARHNKRRALLLTGLPPVAALLALGTRSIWPIVGLALLFGFAVARSAWKARWKTADPVTLMLYGIHSHLQQLPIFWGQLQWARDQAQGRRRSLIEYKEA